MEEKNCIRLGGQKTGEKKSTHNNLGGGGKSSRPKGKASAPPGRGSTEIG